MQYVVTLTVGEDLHNEYAPRGRVALSFEMQNGTVEDAIEHLQACAEQLAHRATTNYVEVKNGTHRPTTVA